MRLPGQRGRFIQEMIWGWPVLLFFIVLAAGQPVVSSYFGKGWGLVAAVVDLAVWSLVRPWRFGLLPPDSRREIFIAGTIAFAGWVLEASLSYWRI